MFLTWTGFFVCAKTRDRTQIHDETIEVKLSNPSANAALGLSQGNVTIFDNEAKPANRTVKVFWVSFNGGKIHGVVPDYRAPSTVSAMEQGITTNGPHWFDEDRNGTVNYEPKAIYSGAAFKKVLEKGDFRWPVAFTRNTKNDPSKIGIRKAYFDVNKPTMNSIWIKATTADGMALGKTATKVLKGSNGGVHYIEKASFSELPDSVKLYDPMIITWEYSLDGKNFSTNGGAGKSNHQIYVTLADPDKSVKAYQTLYHVGCKNGGATSAAEAVKNIWDYINDRKVYTAANDKKMTNPMTYWKGGVAAEDTAGKLIFTNNGQCGAWADFLIDTLKVQGITGAEYVKVTSSYENDGNFINRLKTKMLYHDDDKYGPILVKEWEFYGNGTADKKYKPFLYDRYKKPKVGEKKEGYRDIIPNVNWGKAQGNPDPPGEFKEHFIVKYSKQYYDPSYGNGPYASKQAWQNGSLDGISKYFLDGNNLFHLAKPIDLNMLETIINP